jgi:hypothetical protein
MAELPGPANLQLWNIQQLASQLSSDHPYLEFLRVPAMSLGLYRLGIGDLDRQQPHTEDEAYYVIQGSATFVQESLSRDVRPGDVIYVNRHIPHRFADITEELLLLVFFSPAEGSLKKPANSP